MMKTGWMTFRRELAIRSGFELFVTTNTTFGRFQRRHIFTFFFFFFFTRFARTAGIAVMIIMLIRLHHLFKISGERNVHVCVFLI